MYVCMTKEKYILRLDGDHQELLYHPLNRNNKVTDILQDHIFLLNQLVVQ